VLLAATSAHGQAPETPTARPGTPDSAPADALFQEGKRLMDEQRFAEACPRLTDSQRLDPAGGTAIAVAVCNESLGKLATAWSSFHEAMAMAKRDGRKDREKRARDGIAALEPRLPRLTITVEGDPAVSVRRDGNEVPPTAWGTPVPVDPGEHVIEADAAGKQRWTQRVVVVEGESKSITVASLAAAAPLVRPTPSTAQRTAGWAVGGVGVAGILTGTVAGAIAYSKARSANDRCPGTDCTDAGAVNDSHAAGRAAVVSNVGFAVGAVGVLTGVVLLVTAAKADGGTQLGLVAGPGGVSAGVHGRF
jgi:hypothetical protein